MKKIVILSHQSHTPRSQLLASLLKELFPETEIDIVPGGTEPTRSDPPPRS